MNIDELPLLELFTRLRQAGLPLGVTEYQLVLKALETGNGIADREALGRLCCTLWVKSDEDKLLFNYHFEQVMAEDEAKFVPEEEFLPIVDESELPKNEPSQWWRRVSSSTRLVLGGSLILLAGIGLWSARPARECPYFIGKPKQLIREGEDYTHKVSVKTCENDLDNNVEIKALQKHPWLKLNPQDDITTLEGKHQGSFYIVLSSWSLQRNQLETKIFGNLKRIKTINISPDRQFLVTLLENKTVQWWDKQGNQLSGFNSLDDIKEVNFSPDSKLLVTLLENKTVQLWDRQGNQLSNFNNLEDIEEVNFSPDSKLLVTLLDNGEVQLLDRQGNQLSNFNNLGDIKEVNFSYDNQFFVTLLEDGTAQLWDKQGNQLINLDTSYFVRGINFSPDSQFLVTRELGETARLLDRQGNQLSKTVN